ncbi:MAG: AAA family ATPase [Acidobacteriota bacterium]
MPADTPKSEVIQAVFSVCAAPEVAAAVVTAVGSVPGSEFIGEFQEYISAEKRPQFPPSLTEALGCVAIIDCDRDPVLALETMERLKQTFLHKISLIAISARTDAEFLLSAMRAGCDDVLTKPLDVAIFTAALTRFQKGHVSAAMATQGKGKVISFYGVKGGVGTTTTAVHLATHLVRKHRKKVLLIDYKHELGHVSLHLGIKESSYYFDELVRNVDRLDADLLDGFVTRHSSGLEVIPSPDICALPQEVPSDAISRIMDYLRRRYDFILIDTSMQYTSILTAMMNASDEVALVSTPDVAALRDLVRRIEHLSLIDGFTTKLRVIINRSTSDDAVSAQDIENAIRFPIHVAVPNNYADLMRAINAGEPVSHQQRGAFTNAFDKWATSLVNDGSAGFTSAEPPKKKSFFGF